MHVSCRTCKHCLKIMSPLLLKVVRVILHDLCCVTSSMMPRITWVSLFFLFPCVVYRDSVVWLWFKSSVQTLNVGLAGLSSLEWFEGILVILI